MLAKKIGERNYGGQNGRVIMLDCRLDEKKVEKREKWKEIFYGIHINLVFPYYGKKLGFFLLWKEVRVEMRF